MKKIITIVLLAIVLVSLQSVASAISPFCVPGPSYDAQLCYTDTTSPGTEINSSTVLEIIQNIGGFMMAAAGVIAGIVIIASGLLYMSSGSNTQRLATAKAVFKNGVIGALIIFAAGLIINTIILLASDWYGFFG